MYQNCYVTFIGTCSSQVRWIRQSMRSCQHVKLHSQYVTFLVSSAYVWKKWHICWTSTSATEFVYVKNADE